MGKLYSAPSAFGILNEQNSLAMSQAVSRLGAPLLSLRNGHHTPVKRSKLMTDWSRPCPFRHRSWARSPCVKDSSRAINFQVSLTVCLPRRILPAAWKQLAPKAYLLIAPLLHQPPSMPSELLASGAAENQKCLLASLVPQRWPRFA